MTTRKPAPLDWPAAAEPRCGVSALDVGGITPTCELRPKHVGTHAALVDGRTYRWGGRSGTTFSYQARQASERPFVGLTIAQATKDALTTLATRTKRSRGAIVDDAVRELWARYERGEWPTDEDDGPG